MDRTYAPSKPSISATCDGDCSTAIGAGSDDTATEPPSIPAKEPEKPLSFGSPTIDRCNSQNSTTVTGSSSGSSCCGSGCSTISTAQKPLSINKKSTAHISPSRDFSDSGPNTEIATEVHYASSLSDDEGSLYSDSTSISHHRHHHHPSRHHTVHHAHAKLKSYRLRSGEGNDSYVMSNSGISASRPKRNKTQFMRRPGGKGGQNNYDRFLDEKCLTASPPPALAIHSSFLENGRSYTGDTLEEIMSRGNTNNKDTANTTSTGLLERSEMQPNLGNGNNIIYVAPSERPLACPPSKQGQYLIHEHCKKITTGLSAVEFGIQLDCWKRVVFKTVKDQSLADRELGFMRRVSGKSHIIPLLDSFKDTKGHQIMVFPRLKPAKILDLEFKDIIYIFGGLIRALDSIHKCGVVHLDINPSNLMTSEDSGVCLIDFGLAAEIGTWVSRGTCGFVAPEVLNQARAPKIPLVPDLGYNARTKATKKSLSDSATLSNPGSTLGLSELDINDHVAAVLDGRADIYSAGIVLGMMLKKYLPCADLQFLGGSNIREDTTNSIIAQLNTMLEELGHQPEELNEDPLLKDCIARAAARVQVPSITHSVSAVSLHVLYNVPNGRSILGRNSCTTLPSSTVNHTAYNRPNSISMESASSYNEDDDRWLNNFYNSSAVSIIGSDYDNDDSHQVFGSSSHAFAPTSRTAVGTPFDNHNAYPFPNTSRLSLGSSSHQHHYQHKNGHRVSISQKLHAVNARLTGVPKPIIYAADLLRRMLSADPDERPTAHQVLSHPLFKLTDEELSASDLSCTSSWAEELRSLRHPHSQEHHKIHGHGHHESGGVPFRPVLPSYLQPNNNIHHSDPRNIFSKTPNVGHSSYSPYSKQDDDHDSLDNNCYYSETMSFDAYLNSGD